MTRTNRLFPLTAVLVLASLLALTGCRAHTSARAPSSPASFSGADASGHALGPAGAPVMIEAYQEFQCPYCRRAAATMSGVLAQYPGEVRYVFRHFPLEFHDQARPTAKAAIAAEEQGQFWAYHELMMQAAEEGGLDKQDILDIAATLRLDPARFRATMTGEAADVLIDVDVAAGKALGVTGVPCFFINGRKLSGSQPADKFTAIIDEELTKAADKRRQGIPGYLVSDVLTQENRAAEEGK
jgi:protein-disulfide isomerase